MIGSIDPGLSGALALLDGETLVALKDMPTFDVVRGKAKRRDLDEQGVVAWLREHRPAHGPRRRSRGRVRMRREFSFKPTAPFSASWPRSLYRTRLLVARGDCRDEDRGEKGAALYRRRCAVRGVTLRALA